MIVIRNQKAVEVVVGTEIDLVVTRPIGIPSQLLFSWPASPEIEGGSVRFLRARIVSPPPGTDGGETTHHYDLEAIAPGKANVTLTPTAAGPAAPRPPVRLEITVLENAKESPALPEMILRLAATVATSHESPLEIAKRFGEVESDASSAVYVKPSDSRLKRVIVVRHPVTGDTGSVQLQLAVPGSITAAELEALWGPPQHPPALAIETRTLIFRPPLPEGARFRPTVTLIVDGLEDGPALWVNVIRDIL
jgi:hypothetical protein